MISSYHFDLQREQIYDNIFVYRNLLPDAPVLHNILKESEYVFSGDLIFSEWKDWYTIGKICSLNEEYKFYSPSFNSDFCISQSNLDSLIKEYYLYVRLIQSTNIAINEYIKEKLIDLPDNTFITTPNPAKYNENFHNNEYGYSMNFHTDYQIGEWWWPGEKFLLTCTTYINDDYDGGEIVFLVNNEIIEYKPKAGDIMVFPSGNPLYPGNVPYYHGVKVVTNGIKFLIRNYLKYKTNKNLDVWEQKEKIHGKLEWKKIAEEEVKHTCTLNYGQIFDEDNKVRSTIQYSELVKKIYNIM